MADEIRNEEELRHFHEMDFGDTQFIMEEFVPGDVYSYDAIIDSKGQPLLETGNHTPGSIMDTVNDRKSCVFYIEKQINCPITYVSVGPERDSYIYKGK